MSPVLNIQVIPLAQVPREPSIEKHHNPVVLVVDDERVIADTLSVILSRNGFSTHTAYEGESAIELARTVKPDMLLSDVMMGPGMDGTQLAMRMVKAFPACKVLLFSGHAATMDLLAGARRLGHDFTLMTKPVHPADLLARINQCLTSQGLLAVPA
jgi:DNA-binding response OmpR family regulator